MRYLVVKNMTGEGNVMNLPNNRDIGVVLLQKFPLKRLSLFARAKSLLNQDWGLIILWRGCVYIKPKVCFISCVLDILLIREDGIHRVGVAGVWLERNDSDCYLDLFLILYLSIHQTVLLDKNE